MEFLRNTAIALWLLSLSCGFGGYQALPGDIVFQDLKSPSSEAVKAATDSPYSHCGLVLITDGQPFVLEAAGPVRKIPLAEWIANGGGKFTAVRMRISADFDRVIESAENCLGRPYDPLYEWDDEKLYCSELVYKAYLAGAGIELCRLKRFEEYDIEPVKQAVIDRYGRIPEGLMVVAPGDLAGSILIRTVYSDFPNK